MMRRDRLAAERVAERRRREDSAPRLLTEAPNLESLKLEITERTEHSVNADVAHVRKIVVEHAPALFEIPCTDHACIDGGHDLTRQILHSLHQRLTSFEGDDTCRG